MHSLRFERREGGWDIYLLGRDKPIGDVSPSPFSADEWFGEMTLDGRRAWTFGGAPQDIIDEFVPIMKPDRMDYVKSIKRVSSDHRADGTTIHTYDVVYQSGPDPTIADRVAMGMLIDRVLSGNA